MAHVEVRMLREDDDQVTLLYLVDNKLKSSQVNLNNFGVALDAVKTLVSNPAITPGTIQSVSIDIQTT